MATESVLITAVIEATEGRDVAVIDAPGAFLTAKQEDKEEIIVILKNEMVDTMSDIGRDAYKQ